MEDEWVICEDCVKNPHQNPHILHRYCKSNGKEGRFASKLNNYYCPRCKKRPPNNLIIIAELLYWRV